MDDDVAYKMFPKHRKWFNKLWLAESMEYDCGPCGLAPEKTGRYIVRPIYNLSGMGVGTEFKFIEAGDCTQVPPGYFWCEILSGRHFSVTYEFRHDINPYWKPISGWQGEYDDENIVWKFKKWTRMNEDSYPTLPRFFNELSPVRLINVEFKEDKPFEVHLRDTPNPQYDELIPIWEGDEKAIDIYEKIGYKYISNRQDADGFLKVPRVGFLVK